MIVVNAQRFEVFDKAALQVAGSGGLDCCVNQTLAASHAVEVVLLQQCEPKRIIAEGTQVLHSLAVTLKLAGSVPHIAQP